MSWKLDSGRPIYMQLLEEIQMRIASGRYPSGDRLPSVRELACEAGVNPNTMQKAFTELEKKGLIETRRTAGRFVTSDAALIRRIRSDLALEEYRHFSEKMKLLGYGEAQIHSFLCAEHKEDIT